MATKQKKIKELSDEILTVTMEIKDKYPELYKHLSETPFFSSDDGKEVDLYSMQGYLRTIQLQLKKHTEGPEPNKSVDQNTIKQNK